jgi:hypothetical protein
VPEYVAFGKITANDWNQRKQLLMEEGRDTCEFCGMPAVDAHHGLFGRSKKHKKWTDNELNMAMACEDCNRWDRLADHWVSRKNFLKIQIVRYGYDALRKWLDEAPPGIKRTSDWDYYWNYVEYGE